jgi:hypothetical protein
MFRAFLLGLVVAIIAAVAAAYFVVRDGVVPINADGRPLPLEAWVAATALDAALAREAPTSPNLVSLTDANSYAKHSLGKVSSDLFCHSKFYLTRVTGWLASWITFVETEPRTIPCKGLKPRVPITI